ncbi:thermonuclease family protein [Spirulina sp. CCNP1310]|uniref:thermonuclease family protein n=1 Tax=Spirulina sp. CCNP1310 TaxID=3110249 RepID=UPI002B21B92B|nr:thermonuclease family protein [Spirulina sp. CCNP1310]MEA5419396.1 thermonuclease family protein [Spirulina sp. CCNP1310]
MPKRSCPVDSPRVFRVFVQISKILWIFALLLLSSCQPEPPPPPGLTVTIDRVISGQVVVLRGFPYDPQAPITLRLSGINAPDLEQAPWGEAAQTALENQLKQSPTVTLALDRPEPDQYDRYWGHLWQGDLWMNRWLVAEGYVLAQGSDSPSPIQQRLSHAQDYARIKGVGIWQPDQPLRQTPAEFRR